jgi:hypothetical protein
VKKHSLAVAVAAMAIGGSSFAFGGLNTNPISTVLGYNPFVASTFVGPLPVSNFVGPQPVVTVPNTLVVSPNKKPPKSKKGPHESNSTVNNGLGNGYEDGTPGNAPNNDPEGSSIGNPANKGGGQ